MSTFTTIVLAGDRGTKDPLVEATKVSRKSLVRIHGKPMLLIVLEALVASKHVGQILVVANRVKDMEASARVRDLADEHGIRLVEGASSPASSVLAPMCLAFFSSPFIMYCGTSAAGQPERTIIPFLCFSKISLVNLGR